MRDTRASVSRAVLVAQELDVSKRLLALGSRHFLDGMSLHGQELSRSEANLGIQDEHGGHDAERLGLPVVVHDAPKPLNHAAEEFFRNLGRLVCGLRFLDFVKVRRNQVFHDARVGELCDGLLVKADEMAELQLVVAERDAGDVLPDVIEILGVLLQGDVREVDEAVFLSIFKKTLVRDEIGAEDVRLQILDEEVRKDVLLRERAIDTVRVEIECPQRLDGEPVFGCEIPCIV